MSTAPTPALKLFVKRDLDGFFGLFIDNLVQLLLIVSLCAQCGILVGGEYQELLFGYMLPGAAISILLGNLFYAWQAHRLAKREGRDDVTALPYGINTPSLIVFFYFVMLPVYHSTGSPELAWKMGLVACFGSGVIELLGSFAANQIRRHTPRAALLSTLAGIAIGFISMAFALQIFQRPLVAMLPLALVLITYFSRIGFPWGLPGGLIAVALGTLCAWTLPLLLPESVAGEKLSWETVRDTAQNTGLYAPRFVGGTLWELLNQPKKWLGLLSVILPMGLFNVMGSLQNIESAEAAGDAYDTRSSLAVNGLGTIVASLFGSCFPTTIYIGHPGWKGLGARAGYSTLNGIVILLLCLTGSVGVISSIIPMEAGIAIVLWIGVIITAQAFDATPSKHAPAVAIGLFPAIAAWGATVTTGAFIALQYSEEQVKTTMQTLLDAKIDTEVNSFLLHGLLVTERGYIFTCVILATISASLIDRKFYTAAIWSGIGCVFTFLGLMHAYQLKGNVLDFHFRYLSEVPDGTTVYHATDIAIGYLFCTLTFCLFGALYEKKLLSEVEH